MKRKGKIFDFNDFKEAVSEAKSGKVKVKEMTVQHFFKYEDCMAPQKVNNRKPRPYLNEMVQMKFTRGKFTITYKKSFDDEYDVELDFIKQKCLKNGLPQPTYNETARGITSKRKEDILQRLSSVMPSNRIEFWRSLRVNNDLIDLRTNDED
ncbi:hypothetical protein O0L34_g17802 [Tuta absoluta]|nr:hypothetical protein O0L34_g17802 [Tuta absoluta]